MAEAFGLYPKLVYSQPYLSDPSTSYPLTLEPKYPLLSAAPTYEGVTQSAISARGYRYPTTLRTEETWKISFLLTPHETQQFTQFLTDWGMPGKQFELLLDKRLGMYFTFQSTLYDLANRNPASATSVPSYGYYTGNPGGLIIPPTGHEAVSSPSPTYYNQSFPLIVPGVQIGAEINSATYIRIRASSAEAVNAYTTAFSGFTLIMHFNPFFTPASTDGNSYYYLFQTYPLSGYFGNVLLYGISKDRLVFGNVFKNSSSGYSAVYAASWTPDGTAKVGVAATVTGSGVRGLWMSIDGELLHSDPSSSCYYHTGFGSGEIGALANSSTGVTAGYAAAYPAHMRLLHLATYNWAFNEAEAITQLLSFSPPGRNYFSKAEVMGTEYLLRPANPQGNLWILDLNIRQGV